MNGLKSYIGSLLKATGGVALTYVIAQIPVVSDALQQSGSKTGAVLAVVLALAGSALKDIGLAHKQEKQTEAIKANTEAVKESAVTPQPVIVTK